MKTYKTRITRFGTQFIATIGVSTFSTDECPSHDGVIVTVDGLTCNRLMGCALRRPDDQYNFFEGLRGAIARLPLGLNIRQELFGAVAAQWVDEWLETPGLLMDKVAEFSQMLEQLHKASEGGI